MIRNLFELHDHEFDVLIVGGGIYGVAAAWDATLRGLKVALIEKSDFGSATSSNSLKIIHGGLRYIQQADVKRMRESIRERRILMTIAPHLVHPLPCIMPLYGHLGKGPEAMRIALMLNDLVGFDRNRIDDPQKILPNGKVISRNKCLEVLPGIKENKLTGGAIWYDCHVYNSERLLLSYLRSATERGAKVANYVSANNLIIQNNKVVGIEAKDELTDETFEIRGKIVLNTSGPWVNQIKNWMSSNEKNEKVKLSWAMNIITKKIFDNYAAGVSGRMKIQENGQLVDKGSKVYFITPWRNFSLIGTVHKPYNDEPNEFRIKESYINDLLRDINEALPGNKLNREDIHFFYGGLLPMDRPNPKNGEVVLTKHYNLLDHSKSDGIDGAVSVVGVKYTTARDVSTKAVDLVMDKLGLPKKSTETDTEKLYGGQIERFDEFKNNSFAEWEKRLPESVINQLACNYGSEYSRVLKYGDENPSWLEPIENTAVLKAEVIHAVREEMAVHLIDVLWRRTELGSAGNPGEKIMNTVANLVAKELNWDKNRIEQEIEATKRIYIPDPD